MNENNNDFVGKPGKKLLLVMAILGIVFLLELIGGLLYGSLSLIADSLHVFFDIFSLLITYAALSFATKKIPDDKMTFGYHRLEVFSAMINGVTLIGISLFIMYEAFHRFVEPTEINALYTMVIAIIGFLVNIIGTLIIMTDKSYKFDINIRSAFLHLIGDSAASVSVIIGMTIIIYTGNRIVDPLIAVLISLLLLLSAGRVLFKGTGILLQKSPVNVENIHKIVNRIENVLDIQDIHFWQVCSYFVVGSAHIITNLERLEETEEISKKINNILRNEYKVNHLTLQFETPKMAESRSHDLNHNH